MPESEQDQRDQPTEVQHTEQALLPVLDHQLSEILRRVPPLLHACSCLVGTLETAAGPEAADDIAQLVLRMRDEWKSREGLLLQGFSAEPTKVVLGLVQPDGVHLVRLTLEADLLEL